jgi:hypothetical protein
MVGERVLELAAQTETGRKVGVAIAGARAAAPTLNALLKGSTMRDAVAHGARQMVRDGTLDELVGAAFGLPPKGRKKRR